ncbi:hypothetical protein Q8F55_001310 [Vanrija albida]|uniref:Glutaredoxin-like protein n=1 Tax=Vanrija albida TaxID=181172 RepID=A0ABR3QGQ0_9TREE
MPPKPPLPRLTLFTGPHCSLCDVAKAELAQVRQTHPFTISLWDIRKPPADASDADAARWRRAYQYEIPVLHLDGVEVQKNRIDSAALRRVLEDWSKARRAEGGGE